MPRGRRGEPEPVVSETKDRQELRDTQPPGIKMGYAWPKDLLRFESPMTDGFPNIQMMLVQSEEGDSERSCLRNEKLPAQRNRTRPNSETAAITGKPMQMATCDHKPTKFHGLGFVRPYPNHKPHRREPKGYQVARHRKGIRIFNDAIGVNPCKTRF